MDYTQTIAALKTQRLALDQTISALERLVAAGVPAGEPSIERRGRKGMSSNERESVSIRMKNYWASRRNSNMNHAGST